MFYKIIQDLRKKKIGLRKVENKHP